MDREEERTMVRTEDVTGSLAVMMCTPLPWRRVQLAVIWVVREVMSVMAIDGIVVKELVRESVLLSGGVIGSENICSFGGCWI
jgi:hypothetical protein